MGLAIANGLDWSDQVEWDAVAWDFARGLDLTRRLRILILTSSNVQGKASSHPPPNLEKVNVSKDLAQDQGQEKMMWITSSDNVDLLILKIWGKAGCHV
jgi:hypothetical protein